MCYIRINYILENEISYIKHVYLSRSLYARNNGIIYIYFIVILHMLSRIKIFSSDQQNG